MGRTTYGMAETGWQAARLLGGLSAAAAVVAFERLSSQLPGEPLAERLPSEVPVDDARRIGDALDRLHDLKLAGYLAATAIRAVQTAELTPAISDELTRQLANEVMAGVRTIVERDVYIPVEDEEIRYVQDLAGGTAPA